MFVTNKICFECEALAVYLHHVVPASKGGKKTVPLCALCHGLVHGVAMLDSGVLIKRGLDKAKQNGIVLGRKKIRDDVKIQELRARGFTIRQIAKEIGLSTTAVQRGLKTVLTTEEVT